jgi:DNA-binding Xre family transcriptional regulator
MSILFHNLLFTFLRNHGLMIKRSDIMGLGLKLKKILQDRNMTVKELATKIDVPATTLYSFIKRDSNTAKIDLIEKICDGLNLQVYDFVGEKGREYTKVPLCYINPEKTQTGIINPEYDNMADAINHLRNSLNDIRSSAEKIKKIMDESHEKELQFIESTVERLKSTPADEANLFDLLYYYDELEEIEKTAFMQLLKAYYLLNKKGKNELLKYSETLLDNSLYVNDDSETNILQVGTVIKPLRPKQPSKSDELLRQMIDQIIFQDDGNSDNQE